MRMFPLVCAAALAGLAGAGAASALSPGAPPASRRHRLHLDAATVYSESGLLAQPAVLTVDFDMESIADGNNERRISNIRFALEVKAAGNGSIPAYTMRTLTEDAPGDFFPPDPLWRHRGGAFSKESLKKDEVLFFIEIPANIELRAAGTVLDGAIKRLDDGRAYGGKALVKLYPYCTRDLRTCRPGALSGIAYRKWGLGWVERPYPDFRMISDESFSLIPSP